MFPTAAIILHIFAPPLATANALLMIRQALQLLECADRIAPAYLFPATPARREIGVGSISDPCILILLILCIACLERAYSEAFENDDPFT
jgi:hypothetical protein